MQKKLIKKVKGMDTEFQEYVSKFESEINRGISTLSILSIVNQYGENGVHGYQISKDLEEKTREKLVIEEGTLYPILRKLEENRIIKSEREKEGRKRKFYYITTYGEKIYNYIKEHPGTYRNEIAHELKMPISPLFWHLTVLAKFNFIKKKIIDNHVVYFDFNMDSKNISKLYLISKGKSKRKMI